MEDGPPPREEHQHPEGGTALGDDRCQGRALYPHIQGKNEDGVQDQVDDRAQEGGHHARAAEALGVDEGVHPQADHHGDGPGQVDEKVALGVAHGLVAAAHQVEEGLVEEVEHRREGRAQKEQEGKGHAHDAACPLVVPLPPGDGAQRCAAGAAEVGKGVDDIRHRHHQANAGEGVPAHGVNVADEGPVHHVVEHHRQLGHREGDGQRQDVLGDAALGKVVSPRSHRLSLSSVFPDLILHLIVGYFFKKCKPFPGEKLSGPAGGPPAQPVRQTFP